MKAAIIAAGLGERLRTAGIVEPKPLVRVAGKPLIDHVLGAVAAAGIVQVACIVNETSARVEEHCRTAWPQMSFEILRRTTPSSMESLFALAPLLRQERFLLLTTDAIFAPSVLADFLEAAGRHPAAAGVLALTDAVDDEKPLWVRIDERGRITAIGDEASGSGLVTAGFYVFDPAIFGEIEAARRARLSALRQFLRHLLWRGFEMYGVPVGRTVDVDRPEDIAAAEELIGEGRGW